MKDNIVINSIKNLYDYTEKTDIKKIIIADDLITKDNIDTTRKLLSIVLRVNPSIEVIINNLELEQNERFKNLEFIKNVFLNDKELMNYCNNIFLGTPGTINRRNFINPFQFNTIDNPAYIVNSELVSLKNISKGQSIIEFMADNIKSNYNSELERCLVAYLITTKFKKYIEVDDTLTNSNQSRNLYSILNNEYIVCEGYSRLFNHILEEMDINCSIIAFQKEGMGSHAVSLIEIDGNSYICDPTYDSKKFYDNRDPEDILDLSVNTFAMTFKEFQNKYKVNLEKVSIIRTGEEKLPIDTKEINLSNYYYKNGSNININGDIIKKMIDDIYKKTIKNSDDEEVLDDIEFYSEYKSENRSSFLR